MSDLLLRLFVRAKLIMEDNKGQGLVEYALILVLIAIVVIAAVRSVGSSTNSTFSSINSALH
jgi:pilus assembly protein Flp/PilA